MSSDVVLSAALRNNLLTLQNTQRSIDSTQLRLATGKSVNSALDNPRNFFAAQSLTNRANDLSRLLDGIGQSIRTIEGADKGITALTKLLEQADSIATSALEATSKDSESALITGDTDISGFEVATANADAEITFTFTDKNGIAETVTGGVVALNAGDDADSIVSSINAIRDSDGNKIIEASLTSSGRLSLKTLGGANVNVNIDGDTTGNTVTADSLALASQLGFGTVARAYDSTQGDVAFTVRASSAVTSAALYSDADTIAVRSTQLGALVREAADGDIDADVFTATGLENDDTFSINIGINGSVSASFSVTNATTLQELIDNVNGSTLLKGKVSASFDDKTGRLSLVAEDATIKSIELSTTVVDTDDADSTDDAASTVAFDFGFGVSGLNTPSANDDETGPVTANSRVETIRFGSAGGALGQFEKDYNKIRAQINDLVADASYRGVNLLNGDDLLTVFNEDRTSSLTTSGVNFTADGLGIEEGVFSSLSTITASIDQVRDALTDVRNFGQSVANDLAVIQTRRDFTESTIQTLKAGADDLTLADQNEEGANLLALQTRQQLGITSLALASQSQQAVLRLF